MNILSFSFRAAIFSRKPLQIFAAICSVANKEIKLDRTFASAPPPSLRCHLQIFFRLCVALDWLKIGLNDNIFYFVLIVLEKRDRKHFLVYINRKECFRKVFKVIEIEMFEQEFPIFHKHLNSKNEKTLKVKSFSGFSKKGL